MLSKTNLICVSLISQMGCFKIYSLFFSDSTFSFFFTTATCWLSQITAALKQRIWCNLRASPLNDKISQKKNSWIKSHPALITIKITSVLHQPAQALSAVSPRRRSSLPCGRGPRVPRGSHQHLVAMVAFVDLIFELLLILKVFPFDYCSGCRPQVPLLGATKALLCHQALVHDWFYNKDWLSSCSPRPLQPLLVTDQGWPCSLASNTRWTTEVHHLTWGKFQIKPDSKQRKGKMHQPYHVRKGSSPRVIQDKAAVESTNLP